MADSMLSLCKGADTGNGTKPYRLLFFPMSGRMSRLCKSKYTGNGTKPYRLLFFPIAGRMSRLCKSKYTGNGAKPYRLLFFPIAGRMSRLCKSKYLLTWILVMVPNLPLAVLSHSRKDVQTLQGRSLTKDDQYSSKRRLKIDTGTT
jgi:hypothetical protein